MYFNEKLANGVLYDDMDIDEMLLIVKKDSKTFDKYIDNYCSVKRDRQDIRKFTKGDYVAEDFDRFDSDVAEEFITCFIEYCKAEDFEKYSKGVDKDFINHLKDFYK